jgi:hypothetical protein
MGKHCGKPLQNKDGAFGNNIRKSVYEADLG